MAPQPRRALNTPLWLGENPRLDAGTTGCLGGREAEGAR